MEDQVTSSKPSRADREVNRQIQKGTSNFRMKTTISKDEEIRAKDEMIRKLRKQLTAALDEVVRLTKDKNMQQ